MFLKFSLSLTILTLALNLLSASSAAIPGPLRNSGSVIKDSGNLKDSFSAIRVSYRDPKSAPKAQPRSVARDVIELEEGLVFPDIDDHHVGRESIEARCLVALSKALPRSARNYPVARSLGAELKPELQGWPEARGVIDSETATQSENGEIQPYD